MNLAKKKQESDKKVEKAIETIKEKRMESS